MRVIILALIFSLCLGVYIVYCADGESGIPVLLLDSYGARSLALGDTFTGIANDINTISVNPAGLGTLDSIEATSMFLKHPLDMNYAYVAGGMPIPGKGGVIGASVSIFSIADFDQYDSVGNKTEGALSMSDMGVSVGYANKPLQFFGMGPNLSVGVTLKYVQSKIVDDSVNAICFDVGTLYQFPFLSFGSKSTDDNVGIGVSYQNIGSEVKFGTEGTSLPQNLRFGIGYNGYKSQKHSVLLGVDFNIPNDSDHIMSAGLEYIFIQKIVARVGYKMGAIENEGFSAGGGVIFPLAGKSLNVDYAFIPIEDFGSTHAVSLGVKL